MNVKFELNKIDNSNYRLKFLDYDEKFINFISKKKIVHISFDKKLINIIDCCQWLDCNISNDKFSYYVSHRDYNNNDYSCICYEDSRDEKNSNKYIVLSFNKNEQIIKTNIEDFDKIFIKAIKVLSDTYNNVKY